MSSIFTIQNFFIYVFPLITLLLGYLWHKNQTKKNEITHFSINSYDVGKGLHDEFPEFQLNYKGKELQNEVHVLKGEFVNTGKDIDGLKGKSDIKIILPEECNLKDIKIQPLKDDNDLNINARRDIKNHNIICIGINEKLLYGEGFKYSAIIETTKVIVGLHHRLQFKHRIPNTTILKDSMGRHMEPKRFKVAGYISLIMILLSSAFAFYYLFQQKVQYKVNDKQNDKELSVYITPQSQLYVSDNNWVPFIDNKKQSKEDITNNYNVTLKTTYSWTSYDSLSGILFVLFALIFVFLSCKSFYRWHKENKLFSMIIGQSEQ